MKTRIKSQLQLFLLAIIATFLWGSAFPALKLGFNSLQIDNTDFASQMLFAGIRFFIAGILVLFIGSIIKRNIFIPGIYKSDIPTPKIIKCILLLALTQTFLQYFFYYIGLANVSGSRGAIFNSLGTIITVILGMIYFKSNITINKTIGIIIGLIGVVYLCLFSGVGGEISLLGDGMLLLSSVFSALGNIINKKSAQGIDASFLSGWHLFIGGGILSIIGLIFNGSFTISSISSFLILTYLILISAVAFSIWSYLLKKYPIEKVAIFKFLIPIFGTILSCIFLHESLTIETIVSLVFVCVGIIFVQK